MLILNSFSWSKDLPGIRGVIFDCDGVLFDSREVNRQYYSLIRERLRLPALSAEEEDYVHAHSVHNSLIKIIPQDMLAAAHALRKEISYPSLLPFMRPEPGIYELLDAIMEQRLSCAINTNRTSTMDLLLEHFHLAQFFKPVVTAGIVSQPKPHSESVHLILQQWGFRPREVIYVGDSSLDEAAALGAGTWFFAYKNDSLLAHGHVYDFWDLRRLLQGNVS